MQNRQLTRRVIAGVGISAAILAGALSACGESKSPEKSTTPSTSTSSSTPPPVSSTEKSISPTGGNLFTPPVKAPPAPTGVPGTHHTG